MLGREGISMVTTRCSLLAALAGLAAATALASAGGIETVARIHAVTHGFGAEIGDRT